MPRRTRRPQNRENNRFEYLYVGKQRFSYIVGRKTIKSCRKVQLDHNELVSLYRQASNIGITHILTKKGKILIKDYCNILDINTDAAWLYIKGRFNTAFLMLTFLKTLSQ